MSKYINGHTDVIMGAVMTSHEKFAEDLRFLQNGELYLNYNYVNLELSVYCGNNSASTRYAN